MPASSSPGGPQPKRLLADALSDRGRIEQGRRADLVLVEGDPTRDITAIQAIRQVWLAGHAVLP